jgi:hypothetical protein
MSSVDEIYNMWVVGGYKISQRNLLNKDGVETMGQLADPLERADTL